MSTLPEGLTQAEVDRYAKLDAGIKALADEHKALNDKIKDALPNKSAVYVFGSVQVKINPTIGTFQKKEAAATFPFSSYPEYYTEQIDPEKIRKEVGDAVADLYKPGKTLSVTKIED